MLYVCIFLIDKETFLKSMFGSFSASALSTMFIYVILLILLSCGGHVTEDQLLQTLGAVYKLLEEKSFLLTLPYDMYIFIHFTSLVKNCKDIKMIPNQFSNF